MQVPFIANYRKEYIEPELNIEDLWKIWEWDEKVLLKGTISLEQFLCCFFFCILSYIYIANSELAIITLILVLILSGASFALVRRISIAYLKKCRITSLTRSKRVVINLLMMIQEFCKQKTLTGTVSSLHNMDITLNPQCSEGQLYICSHRLSYGCQPQESLSQCCQILTA